MLKLQGAALMAELFATACLAIALAGFAKWRDAPWLAKIDPSDTGKHDSHKAAIREMAREVERMDRLQYLLYADASQSLLIVLQALDAAAATHALILRLPSDCCSGVECGAVDLPDQRSLAPFAFALQIIARATQHSRFRSIFQLHKSSQFYSQWRANVSITQDVLQRFWVRPRLSKLPI